MGARQGPRKGQQRALTPSCPAHSWPGCGGGIFITPGNTRLCRAGQDVAYLVAGLGLPNEDESVRRDDGQAEVDEDDGPL